jgi:hypothetical protein
MKRKATAVIVVKGAVKTMKKINNRKKKSE